MILLFFSLPDAVPLQHLNLLTCCELFQNKNHGIHHHGAIYYKHWVRREMKGF